MKDLGSFTIPYKNGESYCGKALCDLGASIKLMPMSVFKKLGIGNVIPTTVTLQLPDQSLAHSKEKIKYVLVHVDKFIFPVDFIILDFEVDKEVSVILGRSFIATGTKLIDVQKVEDCSTIVELETLVSIEKECRRLFEDALEFEPLEDENCKENMALVEANLKGYARPVWFELEAWKYTQPKFSIEEPPELELKIILEEGEKVTIDGKMRLNPTMKEVVWKEVIKYLR
ncbi:hypothetical protein EPI10_020263 [Gossypium australe]|uniref:Retrovirus-related Pol polyprotein from transposon opus n=1 Tax=Gossypium australe TaxID=47621 RepID=A0A5B6WF25_9ROSI|nr:hypothetical protein EPI10_020263 [Gossypium australe]